MIFNIVQPITVVVHRLHATSAGRQGASQIVSHGALEKRRLAGPAWNDRAKWFVPVSFEVMVMNTPELHRQIAERAYTIWQREGRPLGLDREHWLRAEHELAAEMIAGAEHAELERLFD